MRDNEQAIILEMVEFHWDKVSKCGAKCKRPQEGG